MAAAVAYGKVPLPAHVRRLYMKSLTILLYVKAAGDSALGLCLASAWLLAAGAGAADLGRVACGSDCTVVVAGSKVGSVSRLSLAALCFPALLVFVHRVAGDISTDEVEDPEIQEYVEKSLLTAALEEVLYRTVMLGMMVTGPFLLLQIVGALLNWNSPGKGSGWSKISVVGALVTDAFPLLH